MRYLSRSLTFIATLILAFAAGIAQGGSTHDKARAEAVALINSPQPAFTSSTAMPSAQKLADLGLAQPHASESLTIFARDETPLHINLYLHKGNTSVLLLHGVTSSSYTYNRMAGKVRDALQASVFALDFRGHGQSGGTVGDVEDVLRYIHKLQPENKLLIAGHSMGGGIALIHATLEEHARVDGYILFAPNLGGNAPTIKQQLPPSNQDQEPFLKLHIPRLVGLQQLNELGIHNYDHLPVMFLNLPPQAGTTQYSYRAMLSTSPANYQDALSAIDSPVLTLVGLLDEAFDATTFPEAMETLKKGQVQIVEGQTHNGIRHSDMAMLHITQWAKKYALVGQEE